MTAEEFDATQWGAGMQCRYNNGGMDDIVSVDFDERLLGIDIYDDANNLKWIRCESAEEVTEFKPS